MTGRFILAFFIAYFIGTIPFGVVFGKLLKGIDVRDYGSGNIGATNVMRVLGPGPGILVFVTDILKGWVPLWIYAHFLSIHNGIWDPWILVICGLLAIAGHNWSAFLKFHGGKGVSTSLGVVFFLDWRIALLCFLVWVIVVAICRYVSLASMLGTLCFPIMILVSHRPIAYFCLGALATLFNVYSHRSNIQRLLAGTESKFGERVKIPEEK